MHFLVHCNASKNKVLLFCVYKKETNLNKKNVILCMFSHNMVNRSFLEVTFLNPLYPRFISQLLCLHYYRKKSVFKKKSSNLMFKKYDSRKDSVPLCWRQTVRQAGRQAQASSKGF